MIRLTAQQHGGARRQAKKEETRYLKYRVCKIVKTGAQDLKAFYRWKAKYKFPKRMKMMNILKMNKMK